MWSTILFGVMDSRSLLLPISASKEEIVCALESSDTLIITGETGSGKSTQVPIIIYEAFLSAASKNAIICVTQPKRIAAMTLAKRVSYEMSVKLKDSSIDTKLGGLVGYSVRFDDKTSSSTRIKYVTDGMLLREYLIDHTLSTYAYICIDEVHERSMRTDILLGLLRDLQNSRKLKIILMSATMEYEKFFNFFSRPSLPKELSVKKVHVIGRQFPVSIFYTEEPQKDYVEAAVLTVFQIHFESPPEGDILVFLTGQEDIEAARSIIISNSPKDNNWKGSPSLSIVPIYAALPPHQQMEAFKRSPPGTRKVILATNIAESSVTIPGIRYVVDCGLSKSRAFHSNFGKRKRQKFICLL